MEDACKHHWHIDRWVETRPIPIVSFICSYCGAVRTLQASITTEHKDNANQE